MGTGSFDRKFGAGLVRELPAEPAVYLFKDEDGTVLYAGKAKNVRRRMQGYRNAGRRKTQRKMVRARARGERGRDPRRSRPSATRCCSRTS